MPRTGGSPDPHEVLHDAGAATTATEPAALLGPVCLLVGPAALEPLENPARPARFERATNGLEERTNTSFFGALAGNDNQEGTARTTPVDVLRALARGDAARAREGGRELAEQLLGSRLVRLAQQVVEGGPHVDARIVELCEAMLDEAAAAARRTG